MGVPGVDADRVTPWLAERVELTLPLRYTLIRAGGSNLTVRVDDEAGRTWALRRPPVTAVLATAHDVEREWRILDALGRDGTVPVPPVVAHCGDDTLIGAPFYVMGFVDGTILRTDEDAARLPADVADTAAASLVDVQVAIHAVDPDTVGLGGLSRHRTGYVERQLHRWRTQVERARVRDLPLLEELHDRLLATVPPPSGPPALVHGDYRFDNTVLGADGRVVAVLDWELATIGDPVADCAWSLLYWTDPGDEDPFLEWAPTLAPTFPRRAEAAARYAARSGRDLSTLPWFTVFGYWKMGCIVEGVYTRRLAGSRSGAASGNLDSIAARAERLFARAAELARGIC